MPIQEEYKTPSSTVRAFGGENRFAQFKEVFFWVAKELEFTKKSSLTESELEILELGGLGEGTAKEMKPGDAISQGIASFTKLCLESLSTLQAAEVQGVKDSRIRQKLIENSLYGFKYRGEWRLPKFQFSTEHKNGLVPNIEGVLRKLNREFAPVSIAKWFSLPSGDLQLKDKSGEVRKVSPLEWLRLGNDSKVIEDLAENLSLI